MRPEFAVELHRRQTAARLIGFVLIILGVVAVPWSTLPWWHIASLVVLGVIFAFPRRRSESRR